MRNMRFLPILVAAVVGIQASPLGGSNSTYKLPTHCVTLEQRCADARADCKVNYKTYGYNSTRDCMQIGHRIDVGDGTGDVCGWSAYAPTCLTACYNGEKRWCFPGKIPTEDLPKREVCCYTQCCDLTPP